MRTIDFLVTLDGILRSEAAHFTRVADELEAGRRPTVEVLAELDAHVDIISGARSTRQGLGGQHLAALQIAATDPVLSTMLDAFGKAEVGPSFTASTFLTETTSQVEAVRTASQSRDKAAIVTSLRSAATVITTASGTRTR